MSKCNQEVLTTENQLKLAFLCDSPEESSTDVFLVITLVTLGVGGLCCCCSFVVFCRYRSKMNNAIDDANLVQDRVHDPVAAQRMIEQ